MDLQTRKLELVKILLKLQDEDLINRIENFLIKERDVFVDESSSSMTIQQLNKRIDQSLEDSKNGKLTQLEVLIDEIEKWN